MCPTAPWPGRCCAAPNVPLLLRPIVTGFACAEPGLANLSSWGTLTTLEIEFRRCHPLARWPPAQHHPRPLRHRARQLHQREMAERPAT
jgi:hypothetical protein